MRRVLIAALMLAAGLSSWAQGHDPQILYVQDSRNQRSIVLANQDGTKAATVYSSKGSASSVDFAPGGGRIAFSDLGTLKLLAYTVSSSGVVVNSVTTLASFAGDPDFSSDGSKIIYVHEGDATTTTRQVRVISASGGSPTVLMDNMSGLLKVVWAGSTSRFIYVRQYVSDLRTEVHLVNVDPGGTVVSDVLLLTTDGPYAFRGIEDIDVARTKDAILLTLNYPTDIRVAEYNLATGQFTDHVSGMRARFSSDDSKIVFVDLSQDYVKSFDVAAGTTTRLTKRGGFSWVDARPPLVTSGP